MAMRLLTAITTLIIMFDEERLLFPREGDPMHQNPITTMPVIKDGIVTTMAMQAVSMDIPIVIIIAITIIMATIMLPIAPPLILRDEAGDENQGNNPQASHYGFGFCPFVESCLENSAIFRTSFWRFVFYFG